MEQLILHLIGDYLTQTDEMATKKTTDIGWAFIHSVVYTLPFAFFLDLSQIAIYVICLSHMVIDRYRLVRYVLFAKNLVTNTALKWEDCQTTGYHKDCPAWLSVWLMIIADNTLHLTINYLAIRYL